ncbi:MAG TPA: DUF4349 domain-containing protein [Allosphingosinicella sp.]|nr:DUF4349 domain-containing protein [Allosphingosinicella sp.]
MRRSLPLFALLLAGAAACGQSGQRPPPPQSEQMSNAAADAAPAQFQADESTGGEAASRRAAAGPNVGPTAAPGVAFNYRYAFRLAAPRIAEVQEQHAQMCERLTVARCRITGMHYRVVNDRDIEAMLAFKLDPSLARLFGRQGVEAVVRAEGMLTESEISGTDVGTAIRAAGRSLADLQADLARIEARLGQRIPSGERESLEYEAQQLRQQIRGLRESRSEQQESLATTPMVFRYGSGDLVPGSDRRPTLKQALQQAGDNFVEGATMLLIFFVTLLPFAIAAALIWAIIVLVRRRWFPKKEAEAPPASA